MIYVARRDKRLTVWFLGTMILGTVIINPLLKILVNRPRPDALLRLIEAEHASFPSGHSLGSIMIYGGIGYVLLHLIDNAHEPYWLRPLVIISALLMSAVIAMSRVYLGVHFMTDVIAGMSLGSFLLLMSIAWYEGRVRKAAVLNTDAKESHVA